ncbi:MAG: hypothetical protein CTR54_19575 [Rhizobium sp.]|nr:MAG: hypothetical protein CTR54_19575 [Rhizobium sp.]
MDKDHHIVFNRVSAEQTYEIAIAHPLSQLLIVIVFVVQPGTAGAEAAVTEFPLSLVAARTCKQVASCAEAVELWCSGYRRAEVDGIREAIGC